MNLREVAEQRKHEQGFEGKKVGLVLIIDCLLDSIGRHLLHIYSEAAGLPVQVLDFYKNYNS